MLTTMTASCFVPKHSLFMRPALRLHQFPRGGHCRAEQISEQEISERIERSQLRKAQKLQERVGCPGCTQKRLAPKSLLSHMLTCCPDLVCDQNVRSHSQCTLLHSVQCTIIPNLRSAGNQVCRNGAKPLCSRLKCRRCAGFCKLLKLHKTEHRARCWSSRSAR